MKGALWEGRTGGTVNDGRLDLFWWFFAGDVIFDTADCGVVLSTTESEYISTQDVGHALEICSDLAECVTTLRMKGKTDGTAGRATAARRGVGRVHHLDARLSWLQRLWAGGVVHRCLRSSHPGEHNEADLESK